MAIGIRLIKAPAPSMICRREPRSATYLRHAAVAFSVYGIDAAWASLGFFLAHGLDARQ